MRFQQATTGDTSAAQAAYRQILDHLAVTVDFPHWHTENHPTPAEVESWVRAGDLHLAVASTGEIAGVVMLNHEAPDAYQDASWSVDATPTEVLVVHALGVTPGFLRQGVARFLVDASLDLARQRDCRVVRLDTYVENRPALELYTRHGFTDRGVHTLHYEGTELSQFHLFEFVL
ncbi:GNAT family N-acetyltransferase [Ornithinimicrobium faecis]|uniref:GNAT family N-acetyltransferase n=1 Tax=Ornithinimicrobium faecis TaxID=2934158 RepID=A0ABY4YZ88_9MICO|nr:GNAT family N-acetyltransferase [Ornithinimicrobium sp. HY1793]USQ82072.1 GNAT family N-acetyltransferase [Ornithinimicrobium sp. HY1793]